MDTISILLVVVVITGSILSLILDDNALPCLITLIIVCVICSVFISANMSKIPVQAAKPIDVATPTKYINQTYYIDNSFLRIFNSHTDTVTHANIIKEQI